MGGFVLSAIALTLWGTLTVGTTPRWLGPAPRTYVARFDNVSGLNEETDVSIAGVQVGSVASIALDGPRAGSSICDQVTGATDT